MTLQQPGTAHWNFNLGYWLLAIVFAICIGVGLSECWKYFSRADDLVPYPASPALMNEARSLDSPFLAYLGHNAITESAAREGLETSRENIERKLGHLWSDKNKMTLSGIHHLASDAQESQHFLPPWMAHPKSQILLDRTRAGQIEHVVESRNEEWRRRTMISYSGDHMAIQHLL